MKRISKLRILLVLVLLISFSHCSKAQIGFSYLHSEVISSFGISTNPEKRIWAEVRLGLNLNWSDASPELIGFYNLVRRDDFDFFLGAGARFNAFEGVIIPAFGFQIRPIDSKPNLAIHTEGMYVIGESAEIFRGSIGLRYYLRKRK